MFLLYLSTKSFLIFSYEFFSENNILETPLTEKDLNFPLISSQADKANTTRIANQGLSNRITSMMSVSQI